MTRRFQAASQPLVEQFEAAFVHAPTGVALIGADGHFLRVNPAAARMLGRSEAELRSLRWQELTGAGEADAIDGEFSVRRPDGSRAWLRAFARALDGDPVRLIVHYEDVTARRESAATLSAVVDAAAEGIIGVDEHDIVRFFSPSAERIFGWRADEVVGWPSWRLIADERQLAARDFVAELRAGRAIQRETYMRRKGGAPIAVCVTASPIQGPGGDYRGAVVTVLDLSGRRTAEREAERSRALLQRVVDQAPNVIWFKDREGRCRLLNRRGSAVLGLAAEDLIGRTDYDVFPEALARRNRDEDAQVMRENRPLTFTKELPLAAGGVAPYVVTKFPIPGPDGRPDGVGLVGSDISELRRGEADRIRLAAIVQAAPDGVVGNDADGRIATWNPGAERMFGLTAGAAVGRRYEDVVVPWAERDRFRRLRERVRAGATATVRMGGRRAGGAVFPTEVSAAPVVAADGAQTGMVVIVRDIGELVEAELDLRERAAQLERSNADLERFAYAASHDLQEPLRSIKMGAEAVLRAAGERLEEDERALLAHVEEAAARMSEQVDALMQVARVAIGHGPDEPVPVRLALEDALNALRAAIRETGAQIRIQEPLPAAAVPRAELALVLQNLLANAIKFARPDAPPDVRVSGALREGCVEVRIADNGVGLTASDRAEMFGIFGRAQEGVPGTGMGLAVSRRILERRDGSMSASSPGRDRGTEFVVSVPAATPG